MAAELPYVPSAKNLPILFEKIRAAKIPDTFTQKVLSETIGLKSVGDRTFISLLKKLKFLDQSGKPTSSYAFLKNTTEAGSAIAEGIRAAYAPLFTANENANELSGSALTGLVAQVTGSDERIVKAVGYTFSSLVKLANFNSNPQNLSPQNIPEVENEQGLGQMIRGSGPNLKSGFHFNIQVHLPSNATEETYVNIFSAIRKVF
jgi:hypothetical protein